MNKFFNNRGLGLVELLMYFAVFVIIITVVISFTFYLVNFNNKARAMRQGADSANKIMKIITSEIKEADAIYLPTTSPNQLSLKTIRYVAENESESYIDFYLCGSNICLKREFQEPVSLTSENIEVSGLQFSYLLNGTTPSVQIDLAINCGSVSVNLISTASLRKY